MLVFIGKFTSDLNNSPSYNRYDISYYFLRTDSIRFRKVTQLYWESLQEISEAFLF